MFNVCWKGKINVLQIAFSTGSCAAELKFNIVTVVLVCVCRQYHDNNTSLTSVYEERESVLGT